MKKKDAGNYVIRLAFLLGYTYALGIFYGRQARLALDENDKHNPKNGQFAPKGTGVSRKSQITTQTEIQKKIDSIRIDFSKERNILPDLNPEDLKILGKENKPVVLKRNIVDKNEQGWHGKVDRVEYPEIIGRGLYDSTNILKGNRKDRPYIQFLHEKKDGKGYTVLLELEDRKDAFEIVNFYKIREDTVRGLKKREKIK